jgi:hypothetical protein
MVRCLPQLATHLQREGLTSVYALQWFLSFLSSPSFTVEFTAIMWDQLFQSPTNAVAIMLQTTISLMKHLQDELLTLSFDDMFPLLNKLPQTRVPLDVANSAKDIVLLDTEIAALAECMIPPPPPSPVVTPASPLLRTALSDEINGNMSGGGRLEPSWSMSPDIGGVPSVIPQGRRRDGKFEPAIVSPPTLDTSLSPATTPTNNNRAPLTFDNKRLSGGGMTTPTSHTPSTPTTVTSAPTTPYAHGHQNSSVAATTATSMTPVARPKPKVEASPIVRAPTVVMLGVAGGLVRVTPRAQTSVPTPPPLREKVHLQRGQAWIKKFHPEKLRSTPGMYQRFLSPESKSSDESLIRRDVSRLPPLFRFVQT